MKIEGWKLKLLYKYWVILKGIFILYPVIRKALKQGAKSLPPKYKDYQNDEDGYWGDKNKHKGNNYMGWWSNYNGFDISKLSFNKRVWYAYKWSAFRNGAYGLRTKKGYAANMDPTTGNVSVAHNGNTLIHSYKSTRQHEKWRKKLWYDVIWHSNGEFYKSSFRLYPIFNKNLYVRFGWKFYPAHHLDDKYKKQIENGTFYKTNNYTFSVPSVIVRLR